MRRRILLSLLVAVALGGGVVGIKMMSDSKSSFKQSITIDRPVADVWRALTMKTHVDRYYMAPLNADITAVSSEIYYGTPTQKMIVGKVVVLDPVQELTHTFRFSDSSDPSDSSVTYRLTVTGDGTQLDLEHRGYAADSQHYADISMGWPIILNGLKTHLEKTGAAAAAE